MMRIRGTVFEHLTAAGDEEAGIDQDSLKGLFSQNKNPPVGGKRPGGSGGSGGSAGGAAEAGSSSAASAAGTGGKQKQAVITLLDLKRGSNIEIMLSQIKSPLDDIAAAVQTMDTTALDGEAVESMIRFLPTSEELALLNMFEGDEERLGKAERYFRKLGRVAGFESKLRALEFKQGFTAAVNAVNEWIGCIGACAAELKGSDRMGRLIALVLTLGNALNSARGPAAGFALSSLPKLLDTRSFDGKTTLLHYLVAHLESKDADLLHFTTELPHLDRAARLTFTQVEEELAPLHKGLGALAKEVAAATARVAAAETKKAEREAEVRTARADRAAKMARADPRVILDDDDDDDGEPESSGSDSEAKAAAAADAADAKDATAEREFREALSAFHLSAAAELAACVAALDAAKASFTGAARYYGEDVAKMHLGQEPERFAKVIRDFGALIDKAGKDRSKVKAAASTSAPDAKKSENGTGPKDAKLGVQPVMAEGKAAQTTPGGGGKYDATGRDRGEEEDEDGKPKFCIDQVFNEIKQDQLSGLRKVGSPSKRNVGKVPFWWGKARGHSRTVPPLYHPKP